jgi:hypothetical protein
MLHKGRQQVRRLSSWQGAGRKHCNSGVLQWHQVLSGTGSTADADILSGVFDPVWLRCLCWQPCAHRSHLCRLGCCCLVLQPAALLCDANCWRLTPACLHTHNMPAVMHNNAQQQRRFASAHQHCPVSLCVKTRCKEEQYHCQLRCASNAPIRGYCWC